MWPGIEYVLQYKAPLLPSPLAMHRNTFINSMKFLLMILLVTFIVVAAVNPPLLARKINITLEVTHNENDRNKETN